MLMMKPKRSAVRWQLLPTVEGLNGITDSIRYSNVTLQDPYLNIEQKGQTNQDGAVHRFSVVF